MAAAIKTCHLAVIPLFVNQDCITTTNAAADRPFSHILTASSPQHDAAFVLLFTTSLTVVDLL